MELLRRNFAMSLHAEQDFLKRALRDFTVADQEVTDQELAHLFPHFMTDGEILVAATFEGESHGN